MKQDKYSPRLYIAYGSNLNLRGMEKRCPTAEVAGTALLKNYQLVFRDGLATIEPKTGGEVPVLVWDILPRDEKHLDAYEGWPSLYRKENLEVDLNGTPVQTMVYIMNRPYKISPPSKYYYETILAGYRSAGFDENILNSAVNLALNQNYAEIIAKETLYIAYGSNINREQMAVRCPSATVADKTVLEDYELLFREGVACVEPKIGSQVPVLLWYLNYEDEKTLDLYERRYHQEEMTITLDGKPQSAMIYMMDKGYFLSPPHTAYYRTILKGYKSAGFDKQILDKAVHESAVRFEPMAHEHEAPDYDENQIQMEDLKWW